MGHSEETRLAVRGRFEKLKQEFIVNSETSALKPALRLAPQKCLAPECALGIRASRESVLIQKTLIDDDFAVFVSTQFA